MRTEGDFTVAATTVTPSAPVVPERVGARSRTRFGRATSAAELSSALVAFVDSMTHAEPALLRANQNAAPDPRKRWQGGKR